LIHKHNYDFEESNHFISIILEQTLPCHSGQIIWYLKKLKLLSHEELQLSSP